MKRCFWVDEKSEIYIKYHDEEWGTPKFDDRELFEKISQNAARDIKRFSKENVAVRMSEIYKLYQE